MIVRFKEVIPHQLYRGGCPDTYSDLTELQEYGVQQIISLDLKSFKHVEKMLPLSMEVKSFPLLEFEENGQDLILQKLDSCSIMELFKKPTFVHCRYGKDRTGALIARYRTESGWTFEQAIQEAVLLGFGSGITSFETHRFLIFINNGVAAKNKSIENKNLYQTFKELKELVCNAV